MSKVKIRISPDGKREIKVEGVPGGACQVASQPYEHAIRGNVLSDEPTAEMNLPPLEQNEEEQA